MNVLVALIQYSYGDQIYTLISISKICKKVILKLNKIFFILYGIVKLYLKNYWVNFNFVCRFSISRFLSTNWSGFQVKWWNIFILSRDVEKQIVFNTMRFIAWDVQFNHEKFFETPLFISTKGEVGTGGGNYSRKGSKNINTNVSI